IIVHLARWGWRVGRRTVRCGCESECETDSPVYSERAAVRTWNWRRILQTDANRSVLAGAAGGAVGEVGYVGPELEPLGSLLRREREQQPRAPRRREHRVAHPRLHSAPHPVACCRCSRVELLLPQLQVRPQPLQTLLAELLLLGRREQLVPLPRPALHRRTRRLLPLARRQVDRRRGLDLEERCVHPGGLGRGAAAGQRREQRSQELRVAVLPLERLAEARQRLVRSVEPPQAVAAEVPHLG